MSAFDIVVGRLRAAGCVFAEDEAALLIEAASTGPVLEEMIGRRVRGEPLEHVIGFAEFCGLRVAVEPGVFVPRQRTQLLVREATALLEPNPTRRTATTEARPRTAEPDPGRPPATQATVQPRAASHGAGIVVDLACGSGAVGAAVATAVPGIALYAVDIEAAAVRCARRNLAPFGARVHQGDLFAPLPEELRGHVTVLVANVPYVPSEAVDLLPSEAREHEPLVALDGGPDGLDVMRRVTAAAPGWLAPGGHVLFETGIDQVEAALAALAAAGLAPTVVHDEELYATVVIGRAP